MIILITQLILGIISLNLIKGFSNDLCIYKNIPQSKYQSDLNHLICMNKNTYYVEENLKISQITFGLYHYCVNQVNGLIFCKGANNFNQTVIPSDYKSFVGKTLKISSGYHHNCAYGTKILQSSFLKLIFTCWGLNDRGQIDLPSYLRELNEIYDLFLGPYTSCARIYNTIKCWGYNLYNLYSQIGISSRPLLFNNDQTMIKVEFGFDNTVCGISLNLKEIVYPNESNINCWGKCFNNMCNIPNEYNHNNIDISVGHDHVCNIYQDSINNNKTILGCWGNDQHGQSLIPPMMKFQVRSIAAGYKYTCAIRINDFMDCWGSLYQMPVIPELLRNFATKFKVGGRHSCGLFGGELSCYGNAQFGQLNYPSILRYWTEEFSVGWDYSCAISLEKKLSCWGLNRLNQINIPEELINNSVNKVITSLSHSCAIYKDHNKLSKVKCWGGTNEYNQLDIPANVNTAINKISVGDENTCFTRKVYIFWSRLYCIGDNTYGQSDIPVILKYKIIEYLVSGDGHSCASYAFIYPPVRILICWGANSYGQSQVPKSIQKWNEWISISAGSCHTCLVVYKHRWEVKCFGLVQNYKENVEYRMKGVVIKVSAGFTHDCLVSSLGEVQCHGDAGDDDDQYGPSVDLIV